MGERAAPGASPGAAFGGGGQHEAADTGFSSQDDTPF
jgi:hypothetical protein